MGLTRSIVHDSDAEILTALVAADGATGGFVKDSDLGTGVATFLATPSSANLLAAVTNETGTGALVFGTSPTIVTPTFTGTTTAGGIAASGAIVVNTTTAPGLVVYRTDDGANGPGLTLQHITTTPAVSDIAAQITFVCVDSNLGTPNGVMLRGVTRDITPGAASQDLEIHTRVGGSLSTRLIVANGIYTPSATGGDMGSGTINAQGVYDDSVLLTDLVLDYAVTGTFDAIKYATHPLRYQVAAWMFNPDQYAEFWKTERRLPGMLTWDDPADKPSTGESITRLTAVVEMQAALIENLNQRLKVLEQ